MTCGSEAFPAVATFVSRPSTVDLIQTSLIQPAVKTAKTIDFPSGDHDGHRCPPRGSPSFVNGFASDPSRRTVQIVDCPAMPPESAVNASRSLSLAHDGSDPVSTI